jgi:hypothetical protein
MIQWDHAMLSHRWIFGVLLITFCASLLMAAFTTVKRIAIEWPSPSLKLRQSKGDSLPAGETAHHAILRLD